ncbi:MAG: hypothetical protein Q8P07_03715 [bacterium]|nr:hypothetical protein [bacterium]
MNINKMNFNFAVKVNIKSRDFETNFYMIIMAIVSSFAAIWIYSFASDTLSEDIINSTTGLNVLRPRLNEEIIKPPSPILNPKLENILNQLILAKNYDQFAKTNNLYVNDKKVRVIIELIDNRYKLPSEFGIEESRYGNLLQALVQIDDLSQIADSGYIRLIRTPSKASPLGL